MVFSDAAASFTLHHEGTHYVRRFGVEGRRFDFNIRLDQPSNSALSNILDQILVQTLEGVENSTLVGLELGHENLSHSVFVPFKQRAEIRGIISWTMFYV